MAIILKVPLGAVSESLDGTCPGGCECAAVTEELRGSMMF